MKRKITWLALPVVLAALMLVVKWRADHPTPTREDLKMRALMLQPYEVAIGGNRGNQKVVRSRAISQAELKPFIDSLFVLRPDSQWKSHPTGADVKVTIRLSFKVPRIDDVSSMYANLDSKSDNCKVVVVYLRKATNPSKQKAIDFSEYQLHPVTIKRWMALLHADRRIGPKLFAP